MVAKIDSNKARVKRHRRIRKNLSGTTSIPRICVFRSNTNISAQIIDDIRGVTLVSASSLDKEFKDTGASGGNKAAARIVGKLLAEKAVAAGISEVVFDRGGYLYHGRVLELAEGAREGGLKF